MLFTIFEKLHVGRSDREVCANSSKPPKSLIHLLKSLWPTVPSSILEFLKATWNVYTYYVLYWLLICFWGPKKFEKISFFQNRFFFWSKIFFIGHLGPGKASNLLIYRFFSELLTFLAVFVSLRTIFCTFEANYMILWEFALKSCNITYVIRAQYPVCVRGAGEVDNFWTFIWKILFISG